MLSHFLYLNNTAPPYTEMNVTSLAFVWEKIFLFFFMFTIRFV